MRKEVPVVQISKKLNSLWYKTERANIHCGEAGKQQMFGFFLCVCASEWLKL